jgi:hypothetical protein
LKGRNSVPDVGEPRQGEGQKRRHVFVSHSSHDEAVGKRLCKSLEAKGVPCWYSSRPADLDPGTEWDDRIVEALDQSAAVVLLFSKASNGSKWVKREMALANARDLPVLPLRLEAAAPTGGMEAYLSTVQWSNLNLRRWDTSLEPVVRELKRIIAGQPRRKKADLHETRRGILAQLFRIVVGVGLATAVAAGAWYGWINRKSLFPDKPPPEVTTEIKVCTGEYERECGFPHDVYLYCYTDVQAWANARCKRATVQPLGSRGGNKCGYANISVLCTRDAPK